MICILASSYCMFDLYADKSMLVLQWWEKPTSDKFAFVFSAEKSMFHLHTGQGYIFNFLADNPMLDLYAHKYIIVLQSGDKPILYVWFWSSCCQGFLKSFYWQAYVWGLPYSLRAYADSEQWEGVPAERGHCVRVLPARQLGSLRGINWIVLCNLRKDVTEY